MDKKENKRMAQVYKDIKPKTLDKMTEELTKYTIKKVEEMSGVSFHRMLELAIADKNGRCVILGTLVKILNWITKSVKEHDFSPFRIVAGAPENTYPVIREFNKILDKYDETIYVALKNIEILNSTESEK